MHKTPPLRQSSAAWNPEAVRWRTRRSRTRAAQEQDQGKDEDNCVFLDPRQAYSSRDCPRCGPVSDTSTAQLVLVERSHICPSRTVRTRRPSRDADWPIRRAFLALANLLQLASSL